MKHILVTWIRSSHLLLSAQNKSDKRSPIERAGQNPASWYVQMTSISLLSSRHWANEIKPLSLLSWRYCSPQQHTYSAFFWNFHSLDRVISMVKTCYIRVPLLALSPESRHSDDVTWILLLITSTCNRDTCFQWSVIVFEASFINMRRFSTSNSVLCNEV